jgi:hypothetical protein
MIEHLRALGFVSLLRALVELGLGAYLILVVVNWEVTAPNWPTWPPARHADAEPLGGDRTAFLAFGAVLPFFCAVRSAQALCALTGRRWARRAGIVLAVLDLATPITLPFALWGLVVYRHPETRDYFARRAQQRSERRGGNAP